MKFCYLSIALEPHDRIDGDVLPSGNAALNLGPISLLTAGMTNTEAIAKLTEIIKAADGLIAAIEGRKNAAPLLEP